MYRRQHHIENLFAKPGEFRAVATGYGKTYVNFGAMIHLVAGVAAANQLSISPNAPPRKE